MCDLFSPENDGEVYRLEFSKFLCPFLRAKPEALCQIFLWDLHLRVSMGVKEEVLDILQKVWTKLQGLPQASSVELGAFSVLILFVDLQKPTGSPEDWVEWFLYRMQHEPWALGGLVVIGVFVLGILSLIVFALLYGCCCGPKQQSQRKKQSDGCLLL
ncbi:hypothetical protein L3Q82_001083 [Scortum barcoo]|uniref:Uncharacterized protein n=1 Tax=Scortum barcoo TaxID=214431 RepID=A0ACB8WBS0_9TELE|nr:hypothetical protein L3Q82_001083 [Scortum barcoo]